MSDHTHCIYINRAMVFDEGVTWTTVAGLYPHAYVPKEHADKLQARAERAEAQVAARIRGELEAQVAAQPALLLAAAEGLAGALGEALYGLSWALARDRDANPPYNTDPCPPVARGLDAARTTLAAWAAANPPTEGGA